MLLLFCCFFVLIYSVSTSTENHEGRLRSYFVIHLQGIRTHGLSAVREVSIFRLDDKTATIPFSVMRTKQNYEAASLKKMRRK